MTMVVAWLWQGLAVAGAAWCLVRLVPRLSASTRHVVWWLAFGTVATLPWMSWDISFNSAPVWVPSDDATTAPVGIPLASPPDWVGTAVLAVWGIFAAWRVWRIVSSMRAIVALKRQSTPLDARYEQGLALWQMTRTSGRRCDLRVSDRADDASALGFRRPTILLPRVLIDRLSATSIDLVVAHERAHLVRYDDWLRLLQCGVTAVLGLHPAIWLISRQIDLEREAACDDHAIAHADASRSYAECLTQVAALRLARTHRSGLLAPAAAGGTPPLRTRVKRLLDRDANHAPHVGVMPASVSALAFALVLAAIVQTPPVVAFVDAHAHVLPAAPRARSIYRSMSATLRTTPIERASTPARRAAPRREVDDGVAMAPALATAPSMAALIVDELPPGFVLSRTSVLAPPIASNAAPSPQVPPVAVASAAMQEPTTPISKDTGRWSTMGDSMADTGASIGRATQDVGASVGRGAQGVGVSVAKGAQNMGTAIGKWFARVGGSTPPR